MRAAFFLFLAVIFAAPCVAVAQNRRVPGVQPLDHLLPQIRRTHPGRFYDADGPTLGPDGGEHYHLKWMTPDGRIEWLDTDARTGRVLGTSPGRDNFDPPGAAPFYAPAPSFPTPPGFSEPFRGNGYGGYSAGRGQGYGGARGYSDRHGRSRGR